MMEPWFVVVDDRRSSDVHRVDQTKAFHYAASVNEFLDLRCDIDEPASIRHFKPKMFSERFHIGKLMVDNRESKTETNVRHFRSRPNSKPGCEHGDFLCRG